MPHGLKKTRKLRGSRTCGYGRVSQHRKSGGRGGKGRAGGRKHYWIRTIIYEPNRFRSIGFIPRGRDYKQSLKVINIGDLEKFLFENQGLSQTHERLEIDLTKLGYGKLLGQGEISTPMTIRVPSASARAVEKVEAVGGEIKYE